MVKHAAYIKEKTMTPKFRFYQASFSTALLRSAALAVALIVQASPARAEVVTLVCQQEPGPHNTESGGSFTLRADYDRKIVDFLRSDGTAYRSAAATITEGAVSWDSSGREIGPLSFMGSLNRLSGQGNATYWDDRGFMKQMSGLCRRATQKF